MAKDLWQLESDIFTDYEGTITEASFQFSDKGNQIKFVMDEIDGRTDPVFEFYSLPPGWESADGGETIQRIAGDEKGIVKSSQWGKFLAAAGGCNGAREALGDDAPVNALAWIGTRWKMEAVAGKPYKFKDRDTGEMVEGVSKDRNFPTEFLGKDSSVQATGSSSNGQTDNLSVLFTLNDPIAQEKVKELATKLDFSSWFKESFQVVSAAGATSASHPDLIAAMGGRGLYEALGGKG